MMAATSPLCTVRFRPLRMRLSSIWTTKFLISSILNIQCLSVGGRIKSGYDGPRSFSRHPRLVPGIHVVFPELTDRSFERDRDQLLRLDCELHGKLLQHVLHEAVHDEC